MCFTAGESKDIAYFYTVQDVPGQGNKRFPKITIMGDKRNHKKLNEGGKGGVPITHHVEFLN